MKRIALFAAGTLALAGCQDVQPMATEAPEASFARNQNTIDVIVSLKSDFAPGAHAANQARAAEVARGMGISPRHTYGTALFGFAASIPEGRLNALRNDPRVAHVDFDAPVSIPDRVAAPPWERDGGGTTGEVVPWGINRTGADANTNEAAGIHVFIIDTGIDSDHADLDANISPDGYASESCKGGGCNYSWDDDHGHGTHVAGTVGAEKGNSTDVVGMAASVTLHGVKVLSKSGSGTRSGVIAGIDWVTNYVTSKGLGGKSVANMSLGGSGSKTDACTSTGMTDANNDGTIDTYHQALCNSTRAGVVYAVAAGNDGSDAEAAVPAAYDDAVITVSATGCSVSNNVCSSGSDFFESFSNFGNNSASWTTNGSAPVAIGAPGGNILSTAMGGGTTTMSGTSMASPHVAGAAALYLASNLQSGDYSAFSNTRAGLMSVATDASTFGDEGSGDPHNEDFLNAGAL